MFVALVVGIYTALIMETFGRFSFFSEDTSMPNFVIAWFDSMLPITVVVATGWILTYLLHFNFYKLIVDLFSPLANSLNTWWGFTLFLFFTCFIYSMGISGWVLAAMDQPVMLAGIAANAHQYANGQAVTYIFTSELIYSFPWIGGVGCTLVNCFNISHRQVSNLIKQAGKRIEVQQESDERYDTVVELEKSISFVS